MTLVTVTQSASTVARDEVRQLANQLGLLAANHCSTALSGIARGTTAAKVKTVNTTTYRVDGKNYSLAASDDFWTLSGTTVAVSSWQKYLLCIDASAAASIIEGTQSLVSAAAVVLPNHPQAKSILGVLTIATDATHTFIPGTTALNATGITATLIDGFDSTMLHPVVLG